MNNDNLVLLTLDLDMPDSWECKLADKFNDSSFVIRNAHPSGESEFMGLMEIENANMSKVRRFIKEFSLPVKFNEFNPDENIFHYHDEFSQLNDSLLNIDCVLEWPVKLNKKFKRLKVFLNAEDTDNLLIPIEDKGIDILRMSKVRKSMNFSDLFTIKQREILQPTINLGYYDFPRRINLNQLSKELGISPSTLCVHLQKIESKVLGSDLRILQ
ncbi:helix-turn-helix domain-containing protein [Candidatus Pacearchaeota archaeon]|nr:helix-turn-helix domain-containing protein [Candidatus Pacearchaeota archaeon]